MPGFISEQQRQLTRSLRRKQTDAESKMWLLLRDRRLSKYKFRRQFPIGSYIADFCCYEKRLIIELDGAQHSERTEYDQERSRFMESHAYKVLRFWNNDVFVKNQAVCQRILEALEAPHPYSLSPRERVGGEGLHRPSPLKGEGK